MHTQKIRKSCTQVQNIGIQQQKDGLTNYFKCQLWYIVKHSQYVLESLSLPQSLKKHYISQVQRCRTTPQLLRRLRQKGYKREIIDKGYKREIRDNSHTDTPCLLPHNVLYHIGTMPTRRALPDVGPQPQTSRTVR